MSRGIRAGARASSAGGRRSRGPGRGQARPGGGHVRSRHGYRGFRGGGHRGGGGTPGERGVSRERRPEQRARAHRAGRGCSRGPRRGRRGRGARGPGAPRAGARWLRVGHHASVSRGVAGETASAARQCQRDRRGAQPARARGEQRVVAAAGSGLAADAAAEVEPVAPWRLVRAGAAFRRSEARAQCLACRRLQLRGGRHAASCRCAGRRPSV